MVLFILAFILKVEAPLMVPALSYFFLHTSIFGLINKKMKFGRGDDISYDEKGRFLVVFNIFFLVVGVIFAFIGIADLWIYVFSRG